MDNWISRRRRYGFCVALALALLLPAVGCRPAPARVEAATPSPVALEASPAATAAPPTVTPALTDTPAPTHTPAPEVTATLKASPTPAPLVCSDPRLAALQQQGYAQVPLEQFAILPPY